MEVIFILVSPAVPENVGLSLRALKTMGFDKMRIVGEMDLAAGALRKTAYGSHDILEKVEVFDDLSKALADVDLAVGTTSKKRTTRKDVIEASKLREAVESKGSNVGKLAIVFGSEESGLSKEDINRCGMISTIPLSITYPSLNLAQSVLLYAYEMRELSTELPGETADEGLFRVMVSESEEIFKWLELDRNPALYRRILDRLNLATEKDIHLILSVVKKLKRMKRLQNSDPET